MRALIAATIAAFVQGLVAVAAAPAHAGDNRPVIDVTSSTLVAKGAALEVSYSIVCPDVSKGRHAMFTTVEQGSRTVNDYLEFTCATTPTTITNLVSARGSAPFTRAPVRVDTVVTNFLYAAWEDPGPPGFYRVSHRAGVTPKPGRVLPENTVDIDANLDVVGARVTRSGTVEITQRLTCDQEGLFGFLTTTATQTTRLGLARGSNDASNGMECGPVPQTFTTVVPSTTVVFKGGKAVVESAFAVCEEGCVRAFDTGLVRLRR